MEEKIYQMLVGKLGKTSLSEQTIRGKAARVAKKITNEEEITDDVIADAVDDLKDLEGQLNHDVATAVNAAKKNLTTKTVNPKDPSRTDGGGADDEISKKLAELEAKQAEFDARIKAEDKRRNDASLLKQAGELLKTKEYGCTNDAFRELIMRSHSVNENDTAESIAKRVKKDYDEQYEKQFTGGFRPSGGSDDRLNREYDKKADFEMLKANGLLPKEAKMEN